LTPERAEKMIYMGDNLFSSSMKTGNVWDAVPRRVPFVFFRRVARPLHTRFYASRF
jgi:hypothetical protein